MGVTEEAGKVGTAAMSAMSSQPLAIALLIINVGFLGFAGYVLGQVASNAAERNKTQMELIAKLVGDIRDCRGGFHPTPTPNKQVLPLPALPPVPTTPINDNINN
jgi:hypothetical protein